MPKNTMISDLIIWEFALIFNLGETSAAIRRNKPRIITEAIKYLFNQFDMILAITYKRSFLSKSIHLLLEHSDC